jgi:LmbE family N-acetylglucosaminyl deacetylase
VLLVISPHLDDGILGCADAIAGNPGAVIVAVMGGRPATYPEPLPVWDRECGFAPGADVVAVRWREDEQALALVQATPRWLDFIDHQYAPTARPAPTDIADALAAVVESTSPELVASPVGIEHPDHLLTSAAALELASRTTVPWLLYAEAPYKTEYAEQLERRLASIQARGFAIIEAVPASALATALKSAAIERYATQLPALKRWRDALLPERYWWLRRCARSADEDQHGGRGD